MVIMILFTYHLSLVTSMAQRPLRGNCLPDNTDVLASRADMQRKALPTLRTQWDAERSYPVAVVLVEFSDSVFSSDDPHAFYSSLFNEEGYHQRSGKGCVTEYFRDQSGGLFNPLFEIYGPVKVEQAAKSNSSTNYGHSVFREAMQKVIDANADVDFARYDWDGDGTAEHVIFVYASYGGNESADEVTGLIWPNTSTFTTVSAGSTKFSRYSASNELFWGNKKSSGIGTICHEYVHTLGLPDLYPTSSSSTEYSVVDEWDLMDGGNFADRGWCPPNLSAHEKMLLGWLTPEELTEASTVSALKSVEAGGKAYIIRTDENADEFFLLENRQHEGWDMKTPGHGLVISHVDYVKSKWTGNSVNNDKNHHYYDLVHADNMNYDQWETSLTGSKYSNGCSRLLSTTPYPYVSADTENRALTDTTVPAATIFCGTGLLSKPITDIVEAADGTVSFNFMGGTSSAIVNVNANDNDNCWYDVQGRPASPRQRGLLISGDGRKRINR